MRGTRHYKVRIRAHRLLATMTVLLRRITALLAMLALVGLILLLMWDVYLHHSRAGTGDEPANVSLLLRPA